MMHLVWSKVQSEKNFGLLCDENYPTVFASLDQEGMTPCLRIYPINSQYSQASASSTAATPGSIHPADNLYRVQW